MKRSCLLSAFILLALSILLLSGCSSHSPDEGADEPKAVTLGVWKNDTILPTVNAFNAQQEQFQIRLVIYDSLELMPSSGIPRKSSRMRAGTFRITLESWPFKVTCRTALSLISQNRLRLLKSPRKILLHPIGMKSAPTSECFRRISLLLLISMTGQV